MDEKQSLQQIVEELESARRRLSELEDYETGCRRAEQALTESERKYELLFNSSSDASFLHYPTAEGLPGRFIEVNDGAARMLGYTKEELRQLTPMDITDPDSATLSPAEAMRILQEEGYIAAVETVFVSKDGKRIPAELSLRMLDLQGRKAVFTRAWNISKRKAAEQKLRDSEKRFQLLFNSGNDAVLVQRPTPDGLPGKFIEANDVACQMLGYSCEELHQLTPLEISDVSTWVASPARTTKMLATGKRIVNEALFITRDGKRIPVEVTVRMFDFQGQPAVLIIGRDIRERKKADELKRRNELRLRKMAASCIQAQEQEREVISLEVHDRSLQILLSIYQQIDKLESLVPEGSREQKLAQSLLNLSKQAIGETRNIMKDLYPETLSKFGLISLMDEELRHFKKELNCHCRLDVHCPQRLPGDIETTLYRVFHEALLNIRRHAGNACSVEALLKCKNGFVELVVQDDGTGFDVKAKAKRGVPGGLASMRRRTEIVGGTFSASSVAGRGTSIKVRIPVAGKTGKIKLGVTK